MSIFNIKKFNINCSDLIRKGMFNYINKTRSILKILI